MLVDMIGEKNEIEKAISFLNENNVSVQEESKGEGEK